jgi:hypothetical protein
VGLISGDRTYGEIDASIDRIEKRLCAIAGGLASPS